MPLTLEQLMALKQKMSAQNPRAVPPMTRQPVARGVAPGAYGYADGGDVDPLDAYMPTDAEAEASGFPPGPQRKQYIAQQRMNAAQRVSVPAPAAPAQVAPNPANAGYMPSAQQQMDSGLPPDPRRAAYMAAKAAQAAGQPGYAGGGTVNNPVETDAHLRSIYDQKGLDQLVQQGILRAPGQADINSAQLQAGATGKMANPLYRRTVQPGSVYPTLPDVTDGADVAGPGNQPVDTSNAAMSDLQAKVAQQLAAKKAADAANSNGMADGGEVDDDSEVTEDASPAIEERSSREPSKLDALLAALPKGKDEGREDDGYDKLRDALNASGDKASKEGEMAVNDATGKGVMEGKEVAKGAPKTLVLPNGGMTGDKLAEYVAEHPGPVATTGKNPEAEKKEDEEEPEVVPKSLAKAPAGRVSAPTKAPATKQDEEDEDEEEEAPSVAAAPVKQDPVQALLDKLGIGQQANDRLAQLQELQRQRQKELAIQMGGDTIARAFARGRGANMAPNTEYYNQMNAVAAQPVQAEMQRRAAAKDAIETGMKATDFADKQQTTDPSSPISQAFRSMALTWNPALKSSPGFDKMDAEGVKQMLPGIDMQVKRDYMIQDTQLRANQAREMGEERRATQQSQKQDAAEMRLGTALTQMNSLKGANGPSQKNSQLADRVMDLAKSYDSKDPNSVANARLILNETMGMLAQAANGGIAHEGQVDRIYPQNIADQFAKIKQYVTSAPAGYDIQRYLDQAVQQAKIFKQVGQNYEKKNNAMILYGAKHAVRPEVYEHYKNQLDLDDSDIDNAYSRTGDTTKQQANKASVSASGPYGPTVSQGGHTYTWNSSSKKYE